MPCPEKFRDPLEKFNVDSDTVAKINKGYEDVVSRTPKKIKTAYFKHAVDILTQEVEAQISTGSNMIAAYPKIIASAAQDILSIIMKSCSA